MTILSGDRYICMKYKGKINSVLSKEKGLYVMTPINGYPYGAIGYCDKEKLKLAYEYTKKLFHNEIVICSFNGNEFIEIGTEIIE